MRTAWSTFAVPITLVAVGGAALGAQGKQARAGLRQKLASKARIRMAR
jgi:hypothetical protein